MSDGLPPAQSWTNRPRVLLGLGLFWAGEALVGVGLGVVMVIEGQGMPGWMLGVALFFAVFLAAVGLCCRFGACGSLACQGRFWRSGRRGFSTGGCARGRLGGRRFAGWTSITPGGCR